MKVLEKSTMLKFVSSDGFVVLRWIWLERNAHSFKDVFSHLHLLWDMAVVCASLSISYVLGTVIGLFTLPLKNPWKGDVVKVTFL